MISSFRDDWLRAFFVDDVHSRNFEKLRGKLDGFHSVRVNNQWRLIFRWDGSRGEASRVYLDDHSYR
jgi:proteic killer suppression protein